MLSKNNYKHEQLTKAGLIINLEAKYQQHRCKIYRVVIDGFLSYETAEIFAEKIINAQLTLLKAKPEICAPERNVI